MKKHSKNMKIFWNIERTFKKYTNICIFFGCSFNIFLENIEEKKLVFYKCSFNILNKIWDLASCVRKLEITAFRVMFNHVNVASIRLTIQFRAFEKWWVWCIESIYFSTNCGQFSEFLSALESWKSHLSCGCLIL